MLGKCVVKWLDNTLFSINLLVLDHLSSFQVHGFVWWVAHEASDYYMDIGLKYNWVYGFIGRDENHQTWSFWLQMSEKSRFLSQDVMYDTFNMIEAAYIAVIVLYHVIKFA